MEKHDCVKEKEFGELETKVSRIGKAVEGNGHEGLIITSVRLEETVKGLERAVNELKESMNAFRTMASGYERFQTEYVVMKEAEIKHQLNKRWMVRTIIALGTFLVAAVGVIIKLFTA
jgi:hypothetical protein